MSDATVLEPYSQQQKIASQFVEAVELISKLTKNLVTRDPIFEVCYKL